MSAITGFGPASSLAPLHAKWGWIVALGIVYLVAGIIALGSVFSATVASVLVVGVDDVHRRRRRGHQRLPGQDLGKVHFLAAARRPLHHRRLRRVGQSVAHRGVADLDPRRGAGRLGHHAHLPRLQHEGGIALDLGRCLRPDHPGARPDHPGPLAASPRSTRSASSSASTSSSPGRAGSASAWACVNA